MMARWLEAMGNLEGALALLRRRRANYSPEAALPLASILRDEGRLAAIVGDTVGAVRAYRHYLTLRTDPIPEIAVEVEEVRSALEALMGAGGSPPG